MRLALEHLCGRAERGKSAVVAGGHAVQKVLHHGRRDHVPDRVGFIEGLKRHAHQDVRL